VEETMKKLWITYTWKDNEDKDIDYIIYELDKTDLEVKFDRRNLIPGQRLWAQIGGQITDPNECDAWGIVLTANSLTSQACIEELSYALDRALHANGSEFPLFALLHNVSANELPPALKIRLCIPLGNNTDWTNQVVAAVEKRAAGFVPLALPSWLLTEHKTEDGFALEIRPRFDRISPFAVAVDFEQKASGNVTTCSLGPSGRPDKGYVAFRYIDSESTLTDGTHVWVWGADNEATPTYSYYLFYNSKPPRVWFGHQQKLSCCIFE
jgi:hypothetical protein